MQYKNYSVVFEKEVADLKSQAILLKHNKTGAKVFVLSNDDDNKVFYIGFRTPAKDDTGLPHIMEHSVLCGSEKYPLKDPFVELVKGSLNTFLNAMTFPDKTVYPVASRNDKDFQNLMSVYMDAVFHPNIYKHPEILKQEGWNYSITDLDAPIEYNGVVYNEMKGAFSSPEGVLERMTLNALFPDNSYAFESGGDPEFITDLTYDDFINFHKTYYHPSNSYIYLYGNMDIEERLSWMDKEYLGKYEKISVDSEITEQKAFAEMKVIEEYYPISEEEDEKENTYLSLNIKCGDNLDPYKYNAMQMILYALVDSQGAPIRQKLLDAGIGKDILSGFENGIKEEYFSVIAKNADAGQAKEFLQIINEEFKKAAEGLNHRSLVASLNNLEFKYKEADFGGYPKGLVYGLGLLDSWLYDENQPLLHIECSDTFRFLRDNIETGYYENLIREWLVDSKDSALIILKPKKGLEAEKENAIAEKLEAYKNSLSREELEKLVADTKALAEYQEAPDSKEDMLKIPLLDRSDIKREGDGFSNIEDNVAGMPIVIHDYFTNGIAYVSMVFDSNMIPYEQLPYLSLLKSIVSFVDTEHYSYSDLNDEINIVTGTMGMDMGVYADRTISERFSVLSDFTLKALYGNLDEAFNLMEEVLFTGKYDDEKRLYEIIAELKSKMQMVLMSSGHSAASMRALSYFSAPEFIKEQTNGIRFYKFVEDLEKNFKDRKNELIRNVKDVLAKILSPNGILVSFTGDKEGYECLKKRLPKFYEKLKSFSEANALADASAENKEYIDIRDRVYKSEAIKFERLNEGFKSSSAVQYVARAGRFIEDGNDYHGSMKVLLTMLRYDYLWFNIRVQGGAYGCMCNASPAGNLVFVSYRDPNLERTNEVYDGVAEYAESFEADEREMTKYVLGTMSGIDIPLTPSLKGGRDLGAYLSRINYADIQKAREEIIDCSIEDIHALADGIRKALSMGNVCVLGNEAKIEENKELFNKVSSLFE